MRIFALISLLALILAGCAMSGTSPTSAEQIQGNAIIKPTVTLTDYPDTMISDQPASFSWHVEHAKVVEHTNVHSSFHSDMDERTDSKKQEGSSGDYQDTLTLHSDVERTVYVRAHAEADGAEAHSQTVTIRLLPRSQSSGAGHNESMTAPVKPTPEPQYSGTVHRVELEGFAYNPAVITIAEGDTVVWTNMDPATHTVTLSDGQSSGPLNQGETWAHTFKDAGPQPYHCDFHPRMKGTITVH